jgi:hypothetical protein
MGQLGLLSPACSNKLSLVVVIVFCTSGAFSLISGRNGDIQTLQPAVEMHYREGLFPLVGDKGKNPDQDQPFFT